MVALYLQSYSERDLSKSGDLIDIRCSQVEEWTRYASVLVRAAGGELAHLDVEGGIAHLVIRKQRSRHPVWSPATTRRYSIRIKAMTSPAMGPGDRIAFRLWGDIIAEHPH